MTTKTKSSTRRVKPESSPRRSAAASDTNGSAHTPGPWTRDYNGFFGPKPSPRKKPVPVLTLEDDGCSNSDCCGYTHARIDVTEADARLIAAAPELLAAIKDATADLVREYPLSSRMSGNWPVMHPVIQYYESVIAKAEGR